MNIVWHIVSTNFFPPQVGSFSIFFSPNFVPRMTKGGCVLHFLVALFVETPHFLVALFVEILHFLVAVCKSVSKKIYSKITQVSDVYIICRFIHPLLPTANLVFSLKSLCSEVSKPLAWNSLAVSSPRLSLISTISNPLGTRCLCATSAIRR